MRELKIGRNEALQRLDKYLFKYLPAAPESFIYKMIRKKNITRNKKKAQGGDILSLGDTVQLYLSDDVIEKFARGDKISYPERDLNILYEDGDVILINKPAGMLSQKARPDDLSLNEYLIGYLLRSGSIDAEQLRSFKPAVCNRLDRNTSGIIAAGKSLPGLQAVSLLFKNRAVGKEYLTIVKGAVLKPARLDGFFSKNAQTNTAVINDSPPGDPVSLEYAPVDTNGRITLLNVRLITGKTHQIRAQLASAGHPVAGDAKYGDYSLNRLFFKRYSLRVQLLHSYRLSFGETNGVLKGLSGRTFTAPVPPVFLKILRGEGLSFNEDVTS